MKPTSTLDGIEISCAFDYHDMSTLNMSYIITSVGMLPNPRNGRPDSSRL